MLGLGSRFLFYAILASVASAIQHGFMRSSLKAAAPPSKGMAGRRALISGTAWFALAQVSKADEVKPWMKAFERSAAEPKEVPLDKKGLCATGFFVNYNPGMCTDIGDITQRAKSTELSESELTATSSLEAKLRARQLEAESK